MAEFPALTIWTDAYLGDTTTLTTIEHGAFFLMLMAAWRAQTHDLPDDDRQLARITKMTLAQWHRIRPTLEQFWTISNGRWVNARLLDELDLARKRSAAGKKGARASVEARRNRNAAKGQRFLDRIEQNQNLSAEAVRQHPQDLSDGIDVAPPGPVRQVLCLPSDDNHTKSLDLLGQHSATVERSANENSTITATATATAISVEDKSSTGASAAVVKLDPWKEVYARGRQVFGSSSGGVITNLRKALDDKPRKVLAKIEDAAEQRDPLPWINAYLLKCGTDGLEVTGMLGRM